MGTDLETSYRAYLDTLNEHRLSDLDQHVHDQISYNSQPLSRRQYQDLIAADLAAIPDLRYEADLIVAGADHIACRLVFRCTPEHEFLGFTPNGERLVFAEHVFYRYREGRIAEVVSLIDRWSIAGQLQAPS